MQKNNKFRVFLTIPEGLQTRIEKYKGNYNTNSALLLDLLNRGVAELEGRK